MTSFIVLGCVGGLIPDALRLIKGRYESFPRYLTQPSFWVGLALLVALGGLAAWAGGAHNAKEALAYGFGAPQFISTLASASGGTTVRGVTLRGDQARGVSVSAIRRWWAV
jgi:hypothetical protein